MNAKAIMLQARAPDGTKPYPTEDIRREATKLAVGVQDKYKQLRHTVFENTEVLRARWQNRSRVDRQTTLKNAWKKVSPSHCPEIFGGGRVLPDTELPSDKEMLPYLNLEDLAEKDSLLMLLDTRARHPPHVLALTELNFAPRGEVEPSGGGKPLRDPVLKMQLNDPLKYGSLVEFASADEAANFVGEGKGLSPGAGLQVLYVQDKLLSYLLNVTKSMLRNDELKAIDYSQDIEKPKSLFDHDEHVSEAMDDSIFDIAKKEPYLPPQGLQIGRLLRMVSAECQRAHDRIWDVREDPRYFEAMYNDIADSSRDVVPDKYGRAHTITNESSAKHMDFVAWVLQDLVVRTHYSLVLWDHLEKQITSIQTLSEAYGDVLNVHDLSPRELAEAIQKLYIILGQLETRACDDVRSFTASPDLRNMYERVPGWIGSPTTINESESLKKDQSSKKAFLCSILKGISGGDLNSTNPEPSDDVLYKLDVLETFFRQPDTIKMRKYITTPVSDALNRLSILSKTRQRFHRQPWIHKVLSIFLDKKKAATLLNTASDPATTWTKIFVEGRKGGFVTSPELGKPGPQFYYNVQATETREKNVKMLCAAEANLDKFWSHVDTNLNKLVNNY